MDPAGKAELFCLFKLAVVQLGVEIALREQFFMGPLFGDITVPQDQDEIGIADGGQPVRDHETGPLRVSRSMAFCVMSSVRVSTEDVASSRIRIG